MTEIVTADIYDKYHASLDVCDLQFRSFGQRRSFFGPCSTVVTFEDHVPVRTALEEPGRGRVLVVDGKGLLGIALLGDHLAETASNNGWAGLIINGAIRDSVGVDRIAIGVKALATTARRGWLPSASERDVPLLFGGARFSVGDWVYADLDCVLVSRTEIDLAALAAAPVHAPE